MSFIEMHLNFTMLIAILKSVSYIQNPASAIAMLTKKLTASYVLYHIQSIHSWNRTIACHSNYANKG
ncbi:hypothetical protein TUMEXPCC7403_08040 [Tumidithrix helvetica PCC 7403]